MLAKPGLCLMLGSRVEILFLQKIPRINRRGHLVTPWPTSAPALSTANSGFADTWLHSLRTRLLIRFYSWDSPWRRKPVACRCFARLIKRVAGKLRHARSLHSGLPWDYKWRVDVAMCLPRRCFPLMTWLVFVIPINKSDADRCFDCTPVRWWFKICARKAVCVW